MGEWKEDGTVAEGEEEATTAEGEERKRGGDDGGEGEEEERGRGRREDEAWIKCGPDLFGSPDLIIFSGPCSSRSHTFVGAARITGRPYCSICRGGSITSRPYK